MASKTLFPPLVNSYEPAFVAGSNSSLKIYFSLSSLSNIGSISELTVHAQIYRQDGVKVLDTTNDTINQRYRATGIILNLVPTRSDINDNYYYVTINNSDLKSNVTLSGTTFTGWIPGWTYKVQLRLSTVKYDPAAYPKQEVWLQEFSNSFSEWSTICYTKAISPMRVQIPLFNYDSGDNTQSYDSSTIHTLSAVKLFGTIESQIPEANEDFEYVKVSLYQGNNLLEESGEIYRTEQSNSYFDYDFGIKFQDNLQYKISIIYKTENDYTPSAALDFNFVVENLASETINAKLITVNNDSEGVLTDLTSLDEEEDEGRIALKITSPDSTSWSGNICIRRASQEDNFQTWEDIKILVVKDKNLNDLDLIYDYTIESGVWYKYGIQPISKGGERGILEEMEIPIQRLFNYSYILGQDSKQLKLQFNHTIDNFKYQIYDSKTDTIGGQYPFISRNAVVRYHTFPIGALISFNMDENNTFLKNGKKDIYKYDNIVDLHNNYIAENNRYQYDYTYERDFREEVLNFLQDGKPKLFKSPTEGNIIVRLMDVSCSPDKTLDRMIYSLTCNANEIDDNKINNYLKYGFFNPGTYSTDFATKVTYLGQLDGVFAITDNIFQKIYEKYDSLGQDYGGYVRVLENIQKLSLTINGYYYTKSDGSVEFTSGHQLRVRNSQNNVVMGNNILVNYSGLPQPKIITIYDSQGHYDFDDLIEFYYNGNPLINDSLYLLGDEEGLVTAVDATINFLYSLSIEPFEEKVVTERKPEKGIGQYYGSVKPGTNIFNLIYYQHYVESNSMFKRLSGISSIEIEANPHTVFEIKEQGDSSAVQYHEINDTGVLRLYELSPITSIKYIGKRRLEVPYDDSSLSNEILTKDILDDNEHYIFNSAADVSITYIYVDVIGQYQTD